MPRRIPNIWPFDSFKTSITYNVKSGQAKSTTGGRGMKYKGYQIYRTREGFEVPGLEKGTEFESLGEAKRFINYWSKQRNPMAKKRKTKTKSAAMREARKLRNPEDAKTSWIPCHAIRQLPSGDIQLLTEKGTMSNPGKRKSLLEKIEKTFGKIVKRTKKII